MHADDTRASSEALKMRFIALSILTAGRAPPISLETMTPEQ
jgi:hypothetical protein